MAQAWLLAFLFFNVTACAYQVGGAGREIPGGYRTVAVPVFKNKTQEPGVEVYFTNALVREFERGGIGKVTSKQNAQTTLYGTIDSITYVPGTQIEAGQDAGSGLPSNTVLTTDYRILLQTTLVLVRNSDGKVLWQGGFGGEKSYLSPKIALPSLNSANATYNQSARFQNIQVLANDLMNEAHSRVTENF